MAEKDLTEDKAAVFKVFEASLSDDQRQLLLRYPDILSPDLISQLYQASLERLPIEDSDSMMSPDCFRLEGSRECVAKKPRKKVNSWMAFRSYYSPLIKDLPQKVRSPMLALLWKNDVDHGLWELLSAAFSYIRDNHSEDGIQIDQFLATAAQVVPIVPADQYFERCGWVRVKDVLARNESALKEMPKVTNVSCAGIARYCYRQGLITRPPTLKQVDSRPYKNGQTSASSISFASAGSLPLASRDSEGNGQRITQSVQANDDIAVNPTSFEQDASNIEAATAVTEPKDEVTTVSSPSRSQGGGVHAAMNLESRLSYDLGIQTLSDELDADFFLLDGT